MIALASVLCGCAADPAVFPNATARVWIAADISEKAIGRAPLANVLVAQPVTSYVEVYYQHISSLVEKHDKGQVDAFGVGVCIKFPVRRCE